jgi:hypothetical protein
MNTGLLKIVMLASSIVLPVALGICTVGCSGAGPSSTDDHASPSATVTELAAPPPINAVCERAYENCLANGGDDQVCYCALERCEGRFPFSCRPTLQ